jgi:glycosyltransferase involved in cell wall biosynthesis
MKRKNIRFIVVSHFLINPFFNFSASSTAIRNFLLGRASEVVQIEIPFPESSEKYAYCLMFRNGKLMKKLKILVLKRPVIASYVYHFFLTIFLFLKISKKFDVAIACDNLSFSSLLCFRKMKIVKRMVYYSVDYTDSRFRSLFLNTIYHFFDRISWMSSDENWIVSSRQIEYRRKDSKFFRKNLPHKVVPIGFEFVEKNLRDISQKIKYQLVFVGTLRRSAGPDIAIKAIPRILDEIPEIKMVFIGDGEMRKNLEKLAEELGVSEKVKFLGRIESHKQVTHVLDGSYVGLAPYIHIKGSLSETSDPGKIKLYFSCGLPVISTKVASSWEIIDKHNAGVIIEPSEEDLARAVIKIIRSPKAYKVYRQNAMKLGKRFDINIIFEDAFRTFL